MHLPNLISRTLLALCFLFSFTAIQAAEVTEEERNHLVIHVSENDPAKWNMALNNIDGLFEGYPKGGIVIEVVANGPGIQMYLVKFESLLGARLKEAMDAGVKFSACEKSMRGQKVKKEDLYPGVGTVPFGSVRIANLENDGYGYLKP